MTWSRPSSQRDRVPRGPQQRSADASPCTASPSRHSVCTATATTTRPGRRSGAADLERLRRVPRRAGVRSGGARRPARCRGPAASSAAHVERDGQRRRVLPGSCNFSSSIRARVGCGSRPGADQAVGEGEDERTVVVGGNHHTEQRDRVRPPRMPSDAVGRPAGPPSPASPGPARRSRRIRAKGARGRRSGPARSSSRSSSEDRTRPAGAMSSQATARWRLASDLSVATDHVVDVDPPRARRPRARTATANTATVVEVLRRSIERQKPQEQQPPPCHRLQAQNATAADRGDGTSSASTMATSRRRRSAACAASASRWTQAIDDRAGCRGTGAAARSSRAGRARPPDRGPVAAAPRRPPTRARPRAAGLAAAVAALVGPGW